MITQTYETKMADQEKDRTYLSLLQKSDRKRQRRMNQKEPENLENIAWRSLADTYRTVYARIMSDLRQYGLTHPQYSVLRAVGKSERGSLPMNEIGKQMIVTFANITTIVDNLEKRNLVKRIRNSEDRRIVKVELTPQGSKLFKRILQSHRKHVAKLMHVLSDSELQSLLDCTEKIKKNINAS